MSELHQQLKQIAENIEIAGTRVERQTLDIAYKLSALWGALVIINITLVAATVAILLLK